MNVKAVYICTKDLLYSLTKFKKGERVWMTNDNLDSGRPSFPCYYPESGMYPVFSDAAKVLIPHLKKIKIPKYPMEYYQAKNTMKRIKEQFKMFKLIKKYKP